jgi:hypothetical protein
MLMSRNFHSFGESFPPFDIHTNRFIFDLYFRPLSKHSTHEASAFAHAVI